MWLEDGLPLALEREVAKKVGKKVGNGDIEG